MEGRLGLTTIRPFDAYPLSPVAAYLRSGLVPPTERIIMIVATIVGLRLSEADSYTPVRGTLTAIDEREIFYKDQLSEVSSWNVFTQAFLNLEAPAPFISAIDPFELCARISTNDSSISFIHFPLVYLTDHPLIYQILPDAEGRLGTLHNDTEES